MSKTYPDLDNDFPDIESDQRYLFRDMTIDDVPYVVQYEKLLNALKTAADGATDVSSYQEEWDALVNFKDTDEYKNHVAPLNITANKYQTLEDKTISAQRFAKRQKQQWIISKAQPKDNEQAVDDVWFRIDEELENGLVNTTPFYKGEEGYLEFAVSPKLAFSSNADINNIVSGKEITNPDAVLNNEALKSYTSYHDEEYETYKQNINKELDPIKKDVSSNKKAISDNLKANNEAIKDNSEAIKVNADKISTNKNNISSIQTNITSIQANIRSLQTALQSNAKSLSGTYRTGVISGGETQEHTVSFSSTFNKTPTVLASTGSGEFSITVREITKGGFKFEIRSHQPGTEYASWVDVTWNATADTV